MTWLVIIGAVVVCACCLAGLVLVGDSILRDLSDPEDPHDRTIGRDQFGDERRHALATKQRRIR